MRRRRSLFLAPLPALLPFLAAEPAAGQSVITVAGKSHDTVPATKVPLHLVNSVAVDRAGNVYLTEFYASRIQRVSAATGTLEPVIGFGLGQNSLAESSRRSRPRAPCTRSPSTTPGTSSTRVSAS